MAIVALGTFDGVHLGHRTLLNIMHEEAKKSGGETVVHTFVNHPRMVFAKAPALLMTDKDRLSTLEALGGRVEADEFTKEYAALSPEEFFRNLAHRLKLDTVVTGFNYTFGERGAGNTDTLRNLGEKYGFGCITVPPCLYKGTPVSSTRIREAISAGEMRDATAMLTRHFSMSGKVVANREIGRSIGFPTANIEWPSQMILPRHGVYATIAHINGRSMRAVTNVGNNPTVRGEKVSVETHILDAGVGDIYGMELVVDFVEYLRGEIRFTGLEELRMQIERDGRRALEILEDFPAKNA